MNPYYYDVPGHFIPYSLQHIQYNPHREQPQPQGIDRKVNTLERQNEQQVKELHRLNSELIRQNQEIHRLNGEINRINHELTRLNDVSVKHTRHLNRLNGRLRIVENRLTIPFKPSEGGF